MRTEIFNEGEAAWLSWQWSVCHRPQVELATQLAINTVDISTRIAKFTKAWTGKKHLNFCYRDERKKVIVKALEKYIDAGGILIEPERRNNRFIAGYAQARNEHAFLLRCEGLTYKEISIHLGCSKVVARDMCRKFQWRMRKAMPRTRFYIKR